MTTTRCLTAPAYHAVVAMLFVAGCREVSTLGRARTLDPGRWQWMAAADVTSAPLFTPAPDETAGYAPRIEVAARRGIRSGLELGAKLFPIGAAVETKLQLFTSERLDVALGPELGYVLYTPNIGSNASFHIVPLQVPVLVGVNFGAHQLVVAPKLIGELWRGAGSGSSGSRGEMLWIGSSLAFVWQLRRIAIVPELTTLGRVASDNNVGSGLGGNYCVQAGIGLLFGR